MASQPSSSHCADCGARHHGMCDALSDDDLGVLAKAAQRMTISPGKVFIEEGDPANYFYNINEGMVRVFKALPDGRRHITGFMGAGQFLGLAISGHCAFSAEAMEEVHLCRFSRATLNQVFADFPALERRLLNIAAHELTVAHEQMLLLARKSAVERVSSYLLNLVMQLDACAEGKLPSSKLILKLPISRADLADYLGLTIETVSRSFAQLKRNGLIEFSNAHAVTLLNPQRLELVANAKS
ncbi:MAG: helix-turn-helix domain-containing protein [Acidocella sp.]|nr:helix-turn-helix domain-containing protein [Acidocella sp.]